MISLISWIRCKTWDQWEDLLKMIPGMANNPALQNMKVDERQIARKRAIVSSMTPEERENPDLLNPSRRRRIAAGSGNTFVEVNKFIKDFNQAKQLMQGVMSGDMNKMMKQMGINPNNLPKNMPNMGGMDMSALEGMMGTRWNAGYVRSRRSRHARYEPDVRWWTQR